MRHVTPKPINTTFIHPKPHSCHHCFPQHFVLKIKVNHIIPTMRIIEVSLFIFLVKIRMHRCPFVVAPCMVRHPVNQYFKPHTMRLTNQCFKVIKAPKFRVYLQIAATGVIAAQRAFPVLQTNGRNRHEPQNTDAHFPQSGQVFPQGHKCAFRRILPRIDFVNITPQSPVHSSKMLVHVNECVLIFFPVSILFVPALMASFIIVVSLPCTFV